MNIKNYRLAIYAKTNEHQDLEERKQEAIYRGRLVQSFYRTLFGDRASIEVRGYAIRTDEYGGPSRFMQHSIAAFWDDVSGSDSDDGWRPTHHHIMENVRGPYAGHAEGNNSVSYTNANRGTIIHEAGHTGLGWAGWLGHDGSVRDGRYDEYGGDSFMATDLILFPSAYHLSKFQILPDYLIAEPEGCIHLVTADIDHRNVMEGEHQAVRIDVVPEDNDPILKEGAYWVSLRSHDGPYHDWSDRNVLKVCAKGTIYYERKEIPGRPDASAGSSIAYVSDKDIRVGQTRQLGRYTIKHESNDIGQAVVTIDGAPTTAKPTFTKQSNTTLENINGLYMNELFYGQGYYFREVRENEIIGGWFTGFNNHDQWYYLQGIIEGNVARMRVYRALNGSVEDPSSATMEDIGQALFTKNEDGSFWITQQTVDHGRHGQSLLCFASDIDEPESGIWFDPGRENEGLFVNVSNNHLGNKELVAFFYTYGPPRSGLGPFARKHQRRYMIQGSQQADSSYDCVVFSFESQFNRAQVQEEANITPIGSARVKAHDGNLQFDFEIPQRAFTTTMSKLA